jgi:hypothetical protein
MPPELAPGPHTLSLAGSFGLDRALVWLDGLLDLADTRQLASKGYTETLTLTFRSIARQSTIQTSLTASKMLFATDDAKVLELLKQHILSEATNDSIRLSASR